MNEIEQQEQLEQEQEQGQEGVKKSRFPVIGWLRAGTFRKNMGVWFEREKRNLREAWRWPVIRRHYLFQTFFFCVFCALEFVVLEQYFGVDVTRYMTQVHISFFLNSHQLAVLLNNFMKNVLLIAVVNLILTGLFHAVRPALLISVVFFTVVGIANYVVIAFRGYGIVFSDFYALGTALNVAGNYNLSITPRFLLALGCDALLVASCFLLPKRQHRYKSVKHTFLSLGAIAVSVCLSLWMNLSSTFFTGIMWDQEKGMTSYGYLLYFVSNAGASKISAPAGYSAEKVDEILSAYAETEEAAETETQTPNLIMIMNESYSDLRVLGDFETNEEVMPFYDSLTENTVKGYAQSSVYGGYTANSEFEFLTGCSKVFLPGNPYLQYLKSDLPNLITNLKAQGYTSATAVHPYYKSGYNRSTAYSLLGFDSFLSLEDFSGETLVRDYIGDSEDYQKLIELYETKEEGSSLCVFNVTMQNHGGYGSTSYSFENPICVTSFEADNEVNQYLSLMKMSDDALEELITYFAQVEEPTVIVLFGDHQPHLPDGFYREVMGSFPELFNLEQSMAEHEVPFLIWANYDIEEQQIEHISLNYLSNLLKETVGLKMSDYDRYLLALSEKIPSISATGYYDADGVLHGFDEDEDADSEYQALIDEYEMVQYNYLFDTRNRLDAHYTVSSD